MFHLQDIRDLVLHVIADAPPPNWLRVDVRPSSPPDLSVSKSCHRLLTVFRKSAFSWYLDWLQISSHFLLCQQLPPQILIYQSQYHFLLSLKTPTPLRPAYPLSHRHSLMLVQLVPRVIRPGCTAYWMHFSADRLAVRRRNGGSPTGFVSHNHCLEFQYFYLLHSRVQETGRSCAVCVVIGADDREWLPCSFLYGRRLSEASWMGGDTRTFTTNWRAKEECTETTNIRSRLRDGTLGFPIALLLYSDV